MVTMTEAPTVKGLYVVDFVFDFIDTLFSSSYRKALFILYIIMLYIYYKEIVGEKICVFI